MVTGGAEQGLRELIKFQDLLRTFKSSLTISSDISWTAGLVHNASCSLLQFRKIFLRGVEQGALI